uniref:Uncharacterized protein n=1 Tax=Cannabis sativa TaxID=3483 RepID=A0A803P217_CANSA
MSELCNVLILLLLQIWVREFSKVPRLNPVVRHPHLTKTIDFQAGCNQVLCWALDFKANYSHPPLSSCRTIMATPGDEFHLEAIGLEEVEIQPPVEEPMQDVAYKLLVGWYVLCKMQRIEIPGPKEMLYYYPMKPQPMRTNTIKIKFYKLENEEQELAIRFVVITPDKGALEASTYERENSKTPEMGLLNALMGNIDKNITQIKANTRARLLSGATKGKGKIKEKRANKAKASSATPSGPFIEEVQPLHQLPLAPNRVFPRSSVAKPSQGRIEAIILLDESGEGYVFTRKAAQSLKRPDPLSNSVIEAEIIKKVAEANLYLKRHHDREARVLQRSTVANYKQIKGVHKLEMDRLAEKDWWKNLVDNEKILLKCKVEKEATEAAETYHMQSVEIAFVSTLHLLWNKYPSVLKVLREDEAEYLAKVQALENGTYLPADSYKFDGEVILGCLKMLVPTAKALNLKPFLGPILSHLLSVGSVKKQVLLLGLNTLWDLGHFYGTYRL